MKIKTLSIILGLVCGTGALWAGDLKVKVRIENLPNGKVAYLYQVENNSDQEINGIDIGHLMDENSGYSWELNTAPEGALFGIDDRIPASWGFCPTGWRAAFDRDEDGTQCAITFRISNLSSVIKPGQTLGGFKVVLSNADNSYITAHYMAHIFRRGSRLADYLVGVVEADSGSGTTSLRKVVVKKGKSKLAGKGAVIKNP